MKIETKHFIIDKQHCRSHLQPSEDAQNKTGAHAPQPLLLSGLSDLFHKLPKDGSRRNPTWACLLCRFLEPSLVVILNCFEYRCGDRFGLFDIVIRVDHHECTCFWDSLIVKDGEGHVTIRDPDARTRRDNCNSTDLPDGLRSIVF